MSGPSRCRSIAARAVVEPIRQRSLLWRPYMERHRQNHAWQYHNGGIWPMIGAFWVAAMAAQGRTGLARRGLVNLARVCALDDWSFAEWLQGRTFARRGMAGQSWNAAGFLMAERVLADGSIDPLGGAGRSADDKANGC